MPEVAGVSQEIRLAAFPNGLPEPADLTIVETQAPFRGPRVAGGFRDGGHASIMPPGMGMPGTGLSCDDIVVIHPGGAGMPVSAVAVTLTASERKTLKKRVRGAKTPWRDRLRAQAVLLAARGRGWTG